MYALLEHLTSPPSAEEIAKELDMTVEREYEKLVVTCQWMHLL
jgi:hypothetical protein